MQTPVQKRIAVQSEGQCIWPEGTTKGRKWNGSCCVCVRVRRVGEVMGMCM